MDRRVRDPPAHRTARLATRRNELTDTNGCPAPKAPGSHVWRPKWVLDRHRDDAARLGRADDDRVEVPSRRTRYSFIRTRQVGPGVEVHFDHLVPHAGYRFGSVVADRRSEQGSCHRPRVACTSRRQLSVNRQLKRLVNGGQS
jgi:hypothetical protein